jgi:hypothetical protein
VADDRELEMLALRGSGLSLSEIGRRYGVSRQRVSQILAGAGGAQAQQAARARQHTAARRARDRGGELVALWRQGLSVGEIHRRTAVSYRSIREIVAARATDADRDARGRTHRRAGRPIAFSERDLLRGLRAVAGELRRSPSLHEYDELAPKLGLAAGQTVYMRFGGWRKALAAAGLDSPPLARVYSPRWHIAACWRALESVADELGDPPRYRRYLEIAAQRDDLPSAATVRARLGLWSSIAALLIEQQARNGRRTEWVRATNGRGPAEPVSPPSTNGRGSAEPVARPSTKGDPRLSKLSAPNAIADPTDDGTAGRLPSRLGVSALRYLAEHPRCSGREVKRGLEIRHDSQAWTLLKRLERDGLAQQQPNGSSSAWTLTQRGESVLRSLPEGVYA